MALMMGISLFLSLDLTFMRFHHLHFQVENLSHFREINYFFMHQEKQYLDLLQKILDTGTDRMDRTGVGTRSIFGHQIRFDLSQ